MKLLVSADVDAIGILSRDPKQPNITTVNFKTDDLNIATGARPEHLRQAEFPLVEYDEKTKTFTHHWDKIFLS